MRSSTLAALTLLLGCSGAAGSPPPIPPANAAPAPAARPIAFETPPPLGGADPAPVLVVMKEELGRLAGKLGERADPRPYFIAYEVMDARRVMVLGEGGALVRSNDDAQRSLDVEVRVGDRKLDNTHVVREDGFDRFRSRYGSRAALPVDDDPRALKTALWLATEDRYREAAEQLVRVRAAKTIHVRQEDDSDDFSAEPPATYREAPAAAKVDRAAWEARVRAYSALFKGVPGILEASVRFEVTVETRYLASTEGAEIQLPRTHARISIEAGATADDGMKLSRHEAIDATTPEGLGDDEAVRKRVRMVIDELLAMRRAPSADAFVGPAIVEGRAAGVMFHEIFGHRVEGHRQKNDDEGQTFAKKIGEHVMPDFISVYDDPTARSLGTTFLNGFYRFDDEGVAAQRALLVDGGVLKGFLMSRSPARGFNRSNGHGRRQEGHPIVARQGNLVVEPARVVPSAELRRLLLEEVKRQGKPYGLRFREVSGGYTMTERSAPQAFKVLPVIVHRIYPDGREEMIRGVDFEGTPLTALSKILAAGDDYDVFNGFCGAESGTVPVSAVSPSLLLGQVEIARREKDHDKPPILEAPAPTTGGAK